MMTGLPLIYVIGLLLLGLLGAIAQMRKALDNADIQGFSLWTSIAAILAGLPMFL